jgi:hypothetical protein
VSALDLARVDGCQLRFHRGASFAASTSTVCKCALRCFEIGPRFCLSADESNAEVSPQ